MNMAEQDWNPELYLKFDKERTQPSIDLVSRIDFDDPSSIIDIGCGPGNSTQVLARRWPSASITGVDNSAAMIRKAGRDFPQQTWILLDAGSDAIPGKYDIVYSNAAIQWIPDHAALLEKFHDLLTDKGLLALQVPLFWDMPLGKAIKAIAKEERWVSRMQGASDKLVVHDAGFYYDCLAALFGSISMWQTDYMHLMPSHEAILVMIRSTGLRPYMERLDDEGEKRDFEEQVRQAIKKEYPAQRDGWVIFPFKRLFFVAGK